MARVSTTAASAPAPSTRWRQAWRGRCARVSPAADVTARQETHWPLGPGCLAAARCAAGMARRRRARPPAQSCAARRPRARVAPPPPPPRRPARQCPQEAPEARAQPRRRPRPSSCTAKQAKRAAARRWYSARCRARYPDARCSGRGPRLSGRRFSAACSTQRHAPGNRGAPVSPAPTPTGCSLVGSGSARDTLPAGATFPPSSSSLSDATILSHLS